MSENQKSILVDLVIGLVLAVAMIFLNLDAGYPLFHLLSDSFFVPAVLMLGMGGLRFCTNSGSLDMVGYGFSTIGDNFKKIGRMDGPKETYFEYTERVAQERKPCGHYLIAGAVFLVLALVFLAVNNLIGA